MINLLPTDLRASIHYARYNRHLIRWVWALVFVLVGLLALVGLGYVYLNMSSADYKKNIAASQKQLDDQNYKQVEADVKSMSNNIDLAVQVLSKQVLFSDLLKQLATVLPRDTKLSSLSIVQNNTGIDVIADTRSYEAATQLQVNLSDKDNKIFDKVDIISIECETNDTDGYPCSASLRAQFTKNSEFIFINDTKPKAGVRP